MRTLAFASLLLAALTLAGCADDPETQSTDPDGTTTAATMTTTYPA